MKLDGTIVLLGLFIELSGALILSVEAIGTERISRWRSSLLLFRSGIRNDLRKYGRRTWPETIAFSIFGGIGAISGLFVAVRVFHWTSVLALGLSSGMGAVFFLELVRQLMLLLGVLCNFLNNRVAVGTAGIVGFSVLAVGILLQMLGTLLQSEL